VIAIGYVAYVFIAYHRLPDTDEAVEPKGAPVAANAPLTIATWNLGFGAYSDDYGFFMDGGKESRAFSKEAEAGNYVIAGGDFNKDLLGDSAAAFGEEHRDYNWNQPIPEGTIPEGLTLVYALDEANPVPSNRLADGPYVKGKTFVNTLDGFIVSDNVRVLSSGVIDTGFKCSDHNPVKLIFELMEE